jgi:uncharacterized DUF497 family protein
VTTVFFRAGPFFFEWDGAKARSNRRKHGVSFEEAATVFADPLARVFDDPDHLADEARFLLLGVSYAQRVLIVVHVERGDRLRIISARPATSRERAKLKEGP